MNKGNREPDTIERSRGNVLRDGRIKNDDNKGFINDRNIDNYGYGY